MLIRYAALAIALVAVGCGTPSDPTPSDAGNAPTCRPDAALAEDPCARERDIDGVAYDCRLVSGALTNNFLSGAAQCPDSPIETCTTGELSGDFEATYAFSFIEQVPSEDASRPDLALFRGRSEVVLGSGDALEGEDVGLAEADSETLAFQTLIRVVRGTGGLEDARGHILAVGETDLFLGTGTGTWSGELCLPR